jgi:hypothetical protein
LWPGTRLTQTEGALARLAFAFAILTFVFSAWLASFPWSLPAPFAFAFIWGPLPVLELFRESLLLKLLWATAIEVVIATKLPAWATTILVVVVAKLVVLAIPHLLVDFPCPEKAVFQNAFHSPFSINSFMHVTDNLPPGQSLCPCQYC